MTEQDLRERIQKYTEERDRVLLESRKSIAAQDVEIEKRKQSREIFATQAQSRVDTLNGKIEGYQEMLADLTAGSELETPV